MRRAAASVLMLLGLCMFAGAADSLAGEVVFCVSRDHGAVLMEGRGLCAEGMDEYVISGHEVEGSEDLEPLATFSENGDCEGSGTVTSVGFDRDGDGVLGDGEVMAVSGSCVTSAEDE